MRQKILYLFGALAAILLVRNLYMIFMVVPDEAEQGMIYRIMFFHVPAAWTALLAGVVAFGASIAYLVTRNFRYDSAAVAVTEVGLAFLAVNLVTGTLWARIIWGIWWTWDARLTSALVCWVLYAGYLVLRQGIEDPTTRARLAAVFSIFAFLDIPIVVFSIKWWRTQHPQPVVWAGGSIDPIMKSTLYWSFLAILILGAVMFLIRYRQEQDGREIESLRRQAYAL